MTAPDGTVKLRRGPYDAHIAYVVDDDGVEIVGVAAEERRPSIIPRDFALTGLRQRSKKKFSTVNELENEFKILGGI